MMSDANDTLNRTTLTKATMHILDAWGVTGEEMRLILDLPEGTRSRQFQKYRSHEPFPDNPSIERRADYLLRIAGALRTTYPANPQAGYRWLRQHHRRLGESPIYAMVTQGEPGLIAVLAELDATFCWDLSGSNGGGGKTANG